MSITVGPAGQTYEPEYLSAFVIGFDGDGSPEYIPIGDGKGFVIDSPGIWLADLIPMESDIGFPPGVNISSPIVTISETTTISVDIKVQSAAKRIISDGGISQTVGGLLGISITEVSSGPFALQIIGGWHSDFDTISFTDIPPGEYTILIGYFEYLVEFVESMMLGAAIDWPLPPEGTTAANQAWISGLTFAPLPLRPAQIGISSFQPSYFPLPAPSPVSISISKNNPIFYTGKIINVSVSLPIKINKSNPDIVQQASIPNITIPLTAYQPGYRWDTPVSEISKAVVVYRLLLTGESDGVDDIELPLLSFQCRLRNGQNSYITCVIPDMEKYVPEITSRKNGQIIISKGFRFAGGDITVEEFARGNFYSVRYDEGVNSESITIVAYKQSTNQSPTTRVISDVEYRVMYADGRRVYRAPIDPFLKPGDTADIDGEKIIVDNISFQVSTVNELMEISE
jgi:hypothetical protein